MNSDARHDDFKPKLNFSVTFSVTICMKYSANHSRFRYNYVIYVSMDMWFNS